MKARQSRLHPIDIAAAVYSTETCARPFSEDLWLHFRHGYVFCTPTLFVMGRAVRRKAQREDIASPWIEFKEPDCWWVWLAAGNLVELPKCLPYPLPWFGWERDNRPRFYPAERLEKWLSLFSKKAGQCPPHIVHPPLQD